jgi:hypothetical protein
LHLLAFAAIFPQMRESFLESPHRPAVPMVHEFDAQRREYMIHVKKYVLIVSHLTQVFHIVRSDDVPRGIIAARRSCLKQA